MTHFMYFKHHFHNRDPPVYIKIDDMTIGEHYKSKLLGVIIDEALTWNEHLHHVEMSIS